MPTIGEVYNPLVQAAMNDDPRGHELLQQLGQRLFLEHPDKCPNSEAGIIAARHNLDYYCQYFGEPTSRKVKEFYKLGLGFRGLGNVKFGGEHP